MVDIRSKKAQAILEGVIGRKFGRLTVIGPAPNFYSDHTKPVVCVCDCTNGKTASLYHLKDGHTKSCGCLITEQLRVNGKVARWTMVNRGTWEANPKLATLQRIYRHTYNDGDIPLDEFLLLIQQDCHYCGAPPSNRALLRGSKTEYLAYNGLDRVDSNGLHTLDNVVPCCFECNAAKLDRTRIDFLNWVKDVYDRHCRKSAP